jgi:hypothetical protein
MTNSTDQPTSGNRLRRAQYAAVLVLGGICAYGAVRASFFFLTDFALWTGWPQNHAYLMPLCIDALGATGFLIYGTTRDRFALGVGIGAIAASMLGNAASHWFTTGTLEPSWVWITFSGFVPAVSIGLIVELAVRWLKPKPESEPKPALEPQSGIASSEPARRSPAAGAGSSAAVSGSATSSSTSIRNGGRAPAVSASANGRSSATRRRTDEDLVREIVDQQWSMLSGDELAKRLRVAKGKALDVRRQARDQMSLSDGNGKVATGISG